MAAGPHSIDPTTYLDELLSQASPDLMRQMLQNFINQILSTEALGFSADGKAGYDYLAGRFTRDDPKVAVNLSGGLKSKGHPVGATGASMHALLYKQIIGEPIGVKARKADIGVAFNVGGSAVTNCVTVLKKF